MKSKSLALVTLLLVTAFLLMQAIAPHTALADASWTDTGGGVSSDVVRSLAYDSSHNLLYAGTYYNGVWKYDGTTWTDTDDGMSGYDIDSLVYDSVHNLLYAGTHQHGVWKYDGNTWTNTGGGLSSYDIFSLAYDSGHNLLYAGAGSHGLWKYDGTTWTNTGGGLSTYYILSLAYDSDHNLLYAGTSSGVWKYDGTTWTDTDDGMSGYDIDSLVYDSGHNLLYAGTSSGVWKYDGTTWTDTGGGVSSYWIDSLVYDSGHNLLYAGCYDASTNTGEGVWKYAYSPPVPPADQWKSTFYFAEGDTGTNFQEYATLENPNAVAANAWITCMFTDGTSQSQYYQLAPVSRLTVDINQLVGAGKEVSMRVVSTSPGIVAERPMYFNYNGVWTGGSDAVGATSPNTNWYFAEGTTRTNFDEYLCVYNPNKDNATVIFDFVGIGPHVMVIQPYTIPAQTRKTFNVRDLVGSNCDVAIHVHSYNASVIVERPIYFDYNGITGGSTQLGLNVPKKDFYFAEGCTRSGFQEYLCLANFGGSTANVQATYILGTGQVVDKSYAVSAGSRYTVNVNNEVGAGQDVSVKLHSDQPIATERPMYFNYQGKWTGGHDVVGATAPASTFYFAEGTCRPNFDPYFCIQNPGSTPASVTLTYMKGDGTTATDQVSVPANSRSTVDPRNKLGTGDDAAHDFSTKVTSDQPIIAERPMYFNYNGVWTGGHDVVGFTQ